MHKGDHMHELLELLYLLEGVKALNPISPRIHVAIPVGV
jgi:hypothetical protein